ncbi:MAG: NlpC/P60 family protein [Saccharofermentans sp.]|nr:NlpC/P60 family protein [Saccharofermentans sp.]
MAVLTIDTEWFNGMYSNTISALHDLATTATSVRKAPAAHDSQSAIRFYDNYSYFCRTIGEIINIMVNDWDIINLWVNNMHQYDSNVSRLLDGVYGPVNNNHGRNVFYESFDNYLSHNQVITPAVSYEVNYRESYAVSALLQELFSFKDEIAVLDSKLEAYQNLINVFATQIGLFDGNVPNSIKRYLSQVHISLITSMRTIVSEFQNFIVEYVTMYLNTMPEFDYDYELNDIIDFYQDLQFFRDDYSAEYSSIQSYICSNIDAASLTPLASNEFESFISQINSTINNLRDVARIIRETENHGKSINYTLWFHIMNLSRAGADLSSDWSNRLINYSVRDRMIAFNHYTSNIADTRSYDPDYVRLLGLCASTNSEAESAIEYLRERMEQDLISPFSTIDTNSIDYQYDYRMYAGYDETLQNNIDNFDFSDKKLCLNIAQLYSALINDGYPSNRAMVLTEETVLYNTDALKSATDISSNYESIATAAIRNYVADYSTYIADNDAYGYCQGHRFTGDFDCSSLVAAAYEKAGVRLRNIDENHNPGTSWYQLSSMKEYGFTTVSFENGKAAEELLPGDIFVQNYDKPGDWPAHAQIAINDSEAVSANVSEDVYRGSDSDTAHRRSDLCAGDQQQGRSLEALKVPIAPADIVPDDCENKPNYLYYYDRFIHNEERFITNPDNGTDAHEHDRVGEIRVQSIYQEDGSYTNPWDSIYRFDSLVNFKQP